MKLSIAVLDEMPPEQVLAQRGKPKNSQADPYLKVLEIIRSGKVASIRLSDLRGKTTTHRVASIRSSVYRRLDEGERERLMVRRSRDEKTAYVVLAEPKPAE